MPQVETYEPPVLEILGTVAELTLGAGLGIADGLSGTPAGISPIG